MNTIILLLTGIVGAICTFHVNEHLKYGPVRASALLSLGVGLLFYFFPNVLNPYLTRNIPVVFTGSSFIGMVSSNVVSYYFTLFIAGILFVVIYLNASLFFKGYGGALGTSASIALMATLGLATFISKYRIYERMLLLKRRIFGKRNL